MAVRPAKRRLKRQMQPIKAQRERHDQASRHLRFHILEVTLIRTAVVFRLMPPASDHVHASCRSTAELSKAARRCSPLIGNHLDSAFDTSGDEFSIED